jgi:hypothetical protein
MEPDSIPYWWCNECKDNVFILQAYGIGLFCRVCGAKVVRPKNRPDIGSKKIDSEDGEFFYMDLEQEIDEDD